MGKLNDKVVIITGGASGIGRASALTFVREGAKVVVADVSVKGGDDTVQMIRKSGGEAIFVKTDISKSADVEAMVNKAVETYGRLDCAFNNAGIFGEHALTVDITEENWDRVISINLKGTWLCMKYEIPQMLKQRAGVIVNTSSTLGLRGSRSSPAYSASKHGIIGLTKSTAIAYRSAGIRVNAVCPGSIHTSMRERARERGGPEVAKLLAQLENDGFVGKPEDVAEAVVWLCSDEASFVTGHSMVVDGGYIIM